MEDVKNADNMKVFETKWEQENKNIVEKALIIPKNISISRTDIETFTYLDDENDIVDWKSRLQITTIYEVYPDEESFNKRVFPIGTFKNVFYRPTNSWGVENFYEQSLFQLSQNISITGQDLTQGRIINIAIKEAE